MKAVCILFNAIPGLAVGRLIANGDMVVATMMCFFMLFNLFLIAYLQTQAE
jgi:hypothetical protein